MAEQEKVSYEASFERAQILRAYGNKTEWEIRKEKFEDKKEIYSTLYTIGFILSGVLFIIGVIVAIAIGSKESLSIFESIKSGAILFFISCVLSMPSMALVAETENLDDNIHFCNTRIEYYQDEIDFEINSLREKGYF